MIYICITKNVNHNSICYNIKYINHICITTYIWNNYNSNMINTIYYNLKYNYNIIYTRINNIISNYIKYNTNNISKYNNSIKC